MSLTCRVPRAVRPALRNSRTFYASLPRNDLVGPPDPVSNLRPVIYDDAPAQSAPTAHPYSLKEFTGDTREYQWKVQRQELDAYHQKFWTDSNTRFNAAVEARLASLPADCTPYEKELAMSDFYGSWLAQEQDGLRTYNAEWRKRNWDLIALEARVKYQKFMARIGLGSST
ncbi:APOPT family protein [Phanerochaete sordida]|uniref:APOPT family protein n=1 Tax=Phanerochaete sordida TaxID=48140 RepID=A0A9P3G291_9APHY|nr:APOPT family protein [Phanerochaete sordida]